MLRFKTRRSLGQITYPDPETNKTILLLENGGYFYCDERQAKWLSRFPELVEVPGELIIEEEENIFKEKLKKKKPID